MFVRCRKLGSQDCLERMTILFKKIAAILFCLLAVSGCSMFSRGEFPGGSVFKTPGEGSTELDPELKERPIRVEVSQAFVDEGNLHLKVQLESKTELPSDEILVTVRGLKNGAVIESKSQVLSDIIGIQQVSPDMRFALSFALPAGGIEEYQVIAMWGEDAQRALGQGVDVPSTAVPLRPDEVAPGMTPPESEQVAESVKPRPLAQLSQPLRSEKSDSGQFRLVDIKVHESRAKCEILPCDILYSVTARLKNDSSRIVQDIQVALGLFWAPIGAQPNTPENFAPLDENEELISLTNLRLAPGEGKQVRVRVDRPVPVVPGGRFLPHIRLLSVGESIEEESSERGAR